MKYLYFDCSMGTAGDMLCSALFELIDDKQQILEYINNIAIPDVTVSFEEKYSHSVIGTYARILVKNQEELDCNEHRHISKTLDEVFDIIDSINVSANVKNDAKAVYNLIAQAESRVHNEKVSVVHFHEVGMLDAIADIVIFCFLLDKLGVDGIISSPINIGKGTVKCSHGILPVPAPATAELLKGASCYTNDIDGELCTPTGAALLKHFASGFGSMPQMNIEKCGAGFGSKEFERPNCVRAFLGIASENTDMICELSCNIDDMSGEELAFACELLLNQGALDVYTQGINMKKGRPAIMLSVMCKPCEQEKFTELMFKYTTTIGVRRQAYFRTVMSRDEEVIKTPLGNVKVKTSNYKNIKKVKPEYDDLKRLAIENNMSISEVKKLIFD